MSSQPNSKRFREVDPVGSGAGKTCCEICLLPVLEPATGISSSISVIGAGGRGQCVSCVYSRGLHAGL